MDKDKIEKKAIKWAKKNRNNITKSILKSYDKPEYKQKEVVILAGSPGAGKTELINGFLFSGLDKYYIHIDSDECKKLIEGYQGELADCFHKAATKIIEQLIDRCLSSSYNIFLDGTSGSKKVVQKNIKRFVDKGYNIRIFYIHLPPQVAWEFTIARELEGKRKIPLKSFVHQYYNSYNNIQEAYAEYGNKLHIRIIEKIALGETKVGYKIESNEYIIRNNEDFLKYRKQLKIKGSKLSLYIQLLYVSIKIKRGLKKKKK